MKKIDPEQILEQLENEGWEKRIVKLVTRLLQEIEDKDDMIESLQIRLKYGDDLY